MALYVTSSIDVITCVDAPVSIAPRQHNEKLALRRTPNPECQPEIGALPDRDRVPMLTDDWPERHPSDL